MRTATFDTLSPLDFEQLVQDLIQARWGVDVESFSAGRDKGIDLRFLAKPGDPGTIVQCKHYAKSGFSNLHTKMKKEKAKIELLAPRRYLLVTTVPLSVGKKEKLLETLAPWVQSSADIMGAEDLDAMLRTYPEVEKAHYKLWINSTAVLERILNNDVVVRTTGYFEDLRRKSQIYVKNDSFTEALGRLDVRHVCIISGSPGVGKSTLANILLLHMMASGFDPVIVSEDINEADRMYLGDRPQVFLYDDFLGRSSSFEKLGKNEDDRLIRFIERVQGSETKRFVLTTREYLLHQAQADFERLHNPKVDLAKLILDIASYTRLHRAHILYNHLYFSSLSAEAQDAVVRTQAYRRVIDHSNYLPRLVEDAVSLAQRQDISADKFPEYLVDAFDRPEKLWKNILERQFGRSEQVLLLMLLAVGAPARVRALEECYFSVQSSEQLGRFDDTLRAVEGTAVTVLGRPRRIVHRIVDFMNPGVQDAVIRWLAVQPSLLTVAIHGCRTFEQLLILWAHSFHSVPKFASDSSSRIGFLMSYVRRVARQAYERESLGNRGDVKRAMRANGPPLVKSMVNFMLLGPESGMSAEEHMSFVLRVSNDLEVSLTASDWRETTEYLLERWRQGIGDKDDALRLVRLIIDDGTVPQAHRQRLVDSVTSWFVSARRSTHDFVVLRELMELLAGHSTVLGEPAAQLPDLTELAEEYSDIVEGEIAMLDTWEGPASDAQEALDEIEQLALDLDVHPSSSALSFARDRVNEFLEESARAEWEPDDDWRDRAHDDYSQDVDDLFESLTDS